MKSRVARAAALLTSLALVVCVILSCVSFVGERVKQQSGDLELACTLVSESAPSGKDTESFTALSQYLRRRGIALSLYTHAGGTVYASDHVDQLLGEDEREQAGKRGVYEEKSASGDTLLCATDVLEDGSYIKLTCHKDGLWDALLVKKSGVFVMIFLAIGLVFFAVLLTLNSRRRSAISHIMEVLDSFSDGHFEARFTPRSGFSRESMEEYNAILDRIDERIFRQRSRNQALSVVMNQMQNGLVVVDQDMKVILITPAAKRLLGINLDPQGMHINDASQDVRLDQIIADAMKQDGVYTNEVAARTAIGRGHRPLRLYVSPMRKEGKIVGALALVEDITELRRLEQVRTDFAANVSHELKTPLTSIRGFVETLADGAIDNPEMARKFLKIIMMETERLTRLINDILTISKMESGETKVVTERIRLDKMAMDVTDMLSIHAQEKNVTLSCNANRDPIYITGNKDQVEQVLINLVENAIKYNKPEGGSVTVQVFANETEANLIVSDTGIGIAEESIGRLFERFYRVDKGRSRAMGGTGLGLAIVKHIVQSMHGKIEVQSKFGEGTEFLVTLPLAKKTEADSDQELPDDFA